MTIGVLKLPDVKQKTEDRPKKCPYYKGMTFQRWGSTKKKVQDIHVRRVAVYRYRCCHCQRTFRHYPAGSTPADQTKRLEVFSILLWTLGLSYRSAALILSGLKVAISHMTIWRNVQEENIRRKKRTQWRSVRVAGLDGAYVQGWGEKQPVLVAVDLGTGDPIAVGYVNKYDPLAVQRWLTPLVQRHGISVIVTDDLFSYRVVTDKLQLGHQAASSMFGVGLDEACMIWLLLFQKIGCGSWKKSEPCWRSCIPRVENACMPCGNNCPDGIREAKLFRLWKGCATCFCGLPKLGSAIAPSSPNLRFPGPTMPLKEQSVA